MKTLLTLAAVVALSGCSALQAFGEVAQQLNDYERQNPSAVPPRNYFTDPIVQPAGNRSNTQPSTSSDSYQLIMVNTPSGWVQKRCKMLNGKAVHCI